MGIGGVRVCRERLVRWGSTGWGECIIGHRERGKGGSEGGKKGMNKDGNRKAAKERVKV